MAKKSLSRISVLGFDQELLVHRDISESHSQDKTYPEDQKKLLIIIEKVSQKSTAQGLSLHGLEQEELFNKMIKAFKMASHDYHILVIEDSKTYIELESLLQEVRFQALIIVGSGLFGELYRGDLNFNDLLIRPKLISRGLKVTNTEILVQVWPTMKQLLENRELKTQVWNAMKFTMEHIGV